MNMILTDGREMTESLNTLGPVYDNFIEQDFNLQDIQVI